MPEYKAVNEMRTDEITQEVSVLVSRKSDILRAYSSGLSDEEATTYRTEVDNIQVRLKRLLGELKSR